MIIRINKIELYPVYKENKSTTNYNWDESYNIPEDVWDKYIDSYDNFNIMLKEIKEYIDMK